MSQSLRKRNPSYELMEDLSGHSVIYREHGFPCPLVRWHFHKEYELHLIVASSGTAFIGDYIGNFYPGSLFLTGPHLPHNWISRVAEGEVVAKRDMLVNFTNETVDNATAVFPELSGLAPLLERARYGIEFQDPQLIARAEALLQQISESGGATRLGHFLVLMEALATSERYQLLSGSVEPATASEQAVDRTNRALNFIFDHYQRDFTQEEVAEHLGMTPTYFSRFFRQATGRTFVEFVNSLRISKACEMLSHSRMPVTDICFEAGFNNISNFNRRFHQLKGMTPRQYRTLTVQRLTEQNA
ncbi:AraC-like DNA-binding protein [Pseudomonas sp. SORGH_AS199]|uniref:AraC family transcriptional regulator n=1 Tax=Pseudomonas TaxID=286 RepID=UPI0021D9BD97|nr:MULTISPECIES: AraC family transcriptional regulator [Pseudomonas]MDR6229748.1 AraC-like DNA-binding protein [Pseudomonas sp. SORGH_AS_0199]